MRIYPVLFTALALLASPLSSFAVDTPTYEEHIRPIFAKQCAGCHFPEVGRVKGMLDLSSYEKVMEGGGSGEALVPGNAKESPLVGMIEWRVEPHMPPPEKFKQLPAESIELMKAWIDAGAPRGAGGSPAPAPVADAEVAAAPPVPESEDKPAAVPETPGSAATELHEAPYASLAFSPDGKTLARGTLHNVELLDLSSDPSEWKAGKVLTGHADLVRSLSYSPDGKLLAAAGGQTGRQGEVKVWNVADSSLVRTINGHTDNILDVGFSPDGKSLATCGYDKLVKVWEVESGNEKYTLKDHVDAVYSLDWSPDGKLLATGAGDRTIKIWDAETGKRLVTLSDSTDAIMSISFDPEGHYIAAGCADKMIRVWDVLKSGASFTQSALTTGVLVHSAFAHEGTVFHIAYAHSGSRLFSVGEDYQVKIWDTATMMPSGAFETQSDWVMSLAVDPQDRHLAVGRFNATASVYDVESHSALWGDNPVKIAKAEGDAAEETDMKEGKASVKKQGDRSISRVDVDAVIIDATIPPSLASVSPVRAHRGATVEMTVDGMNLAAAEPYFSNDKLKIRLIQNEGLPLPEFEYNVDSTGAQIFDFARPHRLKLEVAIAEDAPVGTHFLFAKTPLGLADAVSFTVLPRPDLGENEPNEDSVTAPILSLPNTIIGSINSGEDIDRFRVPAKAGQEGVFVLTDTSINGRLTLKNGQGEELVTSDTFDRAGESTTLGYRFPADGTYTLELSSRDLAAGQGYRLQAGEFPFAYHFSPVGVPAGKPTRVSVQGFNLGGVSEIEVAAPSDAGLRATTPLPVPAYEGNPISAPRLAVGCFPETNESEPNGEPAKALSMLSPMFVNARIGAASGAIPDVDLYRFTAQQGVPMVIEIQADRFGSPLDSVIEVLDEEGNLFKRAQVRCVARSFMTLSDRDSRASGFRIEDWTALKIGDYAMVGGEILKIRGLPDYADEDILTQQFPSTQRITYFGTSPEHHAVHTPFYKVEIHDPEAELVANGMPVFPLYWRNDDHHFVSSMSRDSYLVFEAPADGDYLVRVSDTMGRGGDNFDYRLVLRSLEPDFDVSVDPYRVNVTEGSAVQISVVARRHDGFEGPITVVAEGLPEGFTMAPGLILEADSEVDMALTAGPGAKSSEPGKTVLFKATAMINGATAVDEARIGEITVVPRKPDLVVQVDKRVIEVEPGEKFELSVKLDRNNGFTSRVPVNVLNLPSGAYVLNTGLNGILVRENEFDRSMEIFVEDWVKPLTQTIYVQARIESRAPGRMLFLSQPIEFRIKPREEPAQLSGITN